MHGGLPFYELVYFEFISVDVNKVRKSKIDVLTVAKVVYQKTRRNKVKMCHCYDVYIYIYMYIYMYVMYIASIYVLFPLHVIVCCVL